MRSTALPCFRARAAASPAIWKRWRKRCLISHMVDELRDIAEVDLNPVFAWEKGLAVADARIVLQAR